MNSERQQHRGQSISQGARVGLVGAGYIMVFHVAGLRRLRNVRIVGLYDVDQSRAEQASVRFQLDAYDSLEELCRDCDVIHVLTPPASHASVALRAMQHGCDVLLEKPLAESNDDCSRIVEAARRHHCFVSVDHSLLLDPFTVKARQLIERGKIGEVQSVTCLRTQRYEAYRGGRLPECYDRAGFPFRDLAVHAFYQIEHFLGPIRGIQYAMNHRGSHDSFYFDQWSAIVECQRGPGVFRLSCNAAFAQDQLIIDGTQGSIRLDRFGMYLATRRNRPLPEHPLRLVHSLSEAAGTLQQVPLNVLRVLTRRMRHYHGLQDMIARFYENRESGRRPPVEIADAARINGWVERVAGDADRRKQFELTDRPSRDASPRVLLTGATGLIGSRTLDHLLRRHRCVRVVCRRRAPLSMQKHKNVDIVYGDLADPETATRAMDGIEMVVHAAGYTGSDATTCWRCNLVATENVIEQALQNRIHKLIYISSLSVLQTAGMNQTLDEQSPYERFPERRGAYTRTKLLAEQAVRSAVEKRGLPAVILRPAEVVDGQAIVLSSGVGQRLGSWIVVLGSGELQVPIVDVGHVAEAIDAVMDREVEPGRIYHLVDPDCPEQNELIKRYRQRHPDSRRISIPAWLLYVAVTPLSIMGWILRRPMPLTWYRLRTALSKRRFSSNRITRELGWPAATDDRLDEIDSSVERRVPTDSIAGSRES